MIRVGQAASTATWLPWGVRAVMLGSIDVLTLYEARAQARTRLIEDRAGDDPIARKRQKRREKHATFRDYMAKNYRPWLEQQWKSGAEQARRIEKGFLHLFGDKPLSEIDSFAVERWRAKRLKAEVLPATCNRDINALRACLSRAVEWGLLAANPLRGVKAAKEDGRAVVRYLSVEEEIKLRLALAARDNRIRAERGHANAWRRERHYAELPVIDGYGDL